eukprot:scaffold437_cov159-Amphora_coffeaeformis.AAC.15
MRTVFRRTKDYKAKQGSRRAFQLCCEDGRAGRRASEVRPRPAWLVTTSGFDQQEQPNTGNEVSFGSIGQFPPQHLFPSPLDP